MNGDWPLKETSLANTTEKEVAASKRARESSWTLVEYRPGRYAKVTPDGTVVGRASEAEVRDWFGARSKEPPRSASRSQNSAPAPEPKQATRGRGLQAWFAAQRQEPQATQAPSSDAPSESTVEETRKPGIRDWLAAQRRDSQPDTSHVASDQPAAGPAQGPSEFSSPSRILVGDRDAAAERPDEALADSAPVDAEPREEAQGQGIDPEPEVLQAELLPSEASEPGPEPGEPESATAAVLETDLHQPESSPQGSRELATEPKTTVEPERDSPVPEAVQLAFMPAVVEENKDRHLEDSLVLAGGAGPVPEDPSPARGRESALAEPSPARATEPVLEEALPAQEGEPTLAESSPQVVKGSTRESRSDEPTVTPTLEPGMPEPAQLAMEPDESEEVKIADSEKELPALESMSSDLEEWMTDEDSGSDGDVDWLDPGTPPSGATARDQAPASEPIMRVGAAQDLDGASPEPIASDGHDRWLWVDPRQERGYDVGTFDLAAFLGRAVDLFRSKDWTGGRKPARLTAHPDEVANGLKAMAESLGLEVVSDPRVTAGTFRLGLPSDTEA